MAETIIKQRLKNTILFVASIFITIIIIASISAYFIAENVQEASRNEIIVETQSFSNKILKQTDSDFEILNTYASVIQHDKLYTSSNFPSLLQEANEQNNFETMAYFTLQQEGIVARLGKEVETHVALSSMGNDISRVVKQALQGKDEISRVCKENNTFIYGVPIYDQKQIIGAFIACEPLDIFMDILDDDSNINKNVYIHMINQNGDFIIRSQHAIIQENINNIFEKSLLSSKTSIQEKMSLNQEVYDSFYYDGKKYQMFIQPLGINNLFLFSVNTLQESNRFLYSIIKIIFIVFIIVFIMIIIILIYSYITVNKHNKELVKLAYHDELTQAYNFTYFHERALKEYSHDSHCCIVAINIYQFKFINEIFGKEQANNLLCHISKVIESHLNENEFFCRGNADLFYLYLHETSNTHITQRIKSIFDDITSLKQYKNSNYRLRLYSGVALAHQDNEQFTIDELMTHVMFALANAKTIHNHKIWFYNPELHKQEKMMNYIEAHMHQALENKEFILYMQPKFNLKTKRITSAEALVRWMRQDGSLIYPNQFIPLFEHNGFCTQLDMYMFECVCKQIHEWIIQGIEPISVSINQSKLLFYESDFIENIKHIIQKYEVPSHLITIEILEGLALENIEELNHKIKLLHDFGSGYSSLNILGKLDIDELKLDQAFLKEASHYHKNTKIIMEEIIQISKRMSISTVIEGVETIKDHQFIETLGCHYGQGYYYDKPMNISEFNKKYMHKY